MHLASQEGHEKAVMLLLDMGAQFSFNKKHLSFFDLALENRHENVILAIIQHERSVKLNIVQTYNLIRLK